MRTKLNFMANKLEPNCFPTGRPSATQILIINANGSAKRGYLREIYQTARSNKIKDFWVICVLGAYYRSILMAVFRRVIKVTG